MKPIPYKISTLIYLQNDAGDLLLMRRNKQPNVGLWSSIGGKLEMATGESPFETAIRETKEETGFEITEKDLHLFCTFAEKNYEDRTHWLMFLFHCKKSLPYLPPAIDEGEFSFHTQKSISTLPIPETDKIALWPLWFKNRDGFTMMRADCSIGKELEIVIEQQIP